PSLLTARYAASATTLLDGKVVVIGGMGVSGELASAEVVDAGLEAFQQTATGLATARQRHSATLLPHNNEVLVLGGTAGGSSVATAELFVPWSGPNGAFCNALTCPTGITPPASPPSAKAWAAVSALSVPASATV